ncbi:MAG: MBL fold metallo-hydrolase [Myxococcota bacterium]|nr:MBL fold metallo-hydrolase [Myxococcota bacterium]
MTSERPKHHQEDGYTNPIVGRSNKGLWKLLKARFSGEWKSPDLADAKKIEKKVLSKEMLLGSSEQARLSWIGHSTFLLQVSGKNILTDPIFSQRASPVSFAGPERYTQPAVTIEDLPKIDLVVISHNHYDHLDEATVRVIGNSTKWCVPLGLKSWFKDIGVTNVVEFDWWDQKEINGIQVTATPSQHWSARGLFDRFDTLWAAWSVQVGAFKSWFAGDTGYNDVQFKEIGQKIGPFDLAMIPIGAYVPRWFMRDFHVNPKEAVKIHMDVRSKYSVAMHWGTFPLAGEGLLAPREDLRVALSELGIDSSAFQTLAIGGQVRVPFDSSAQTAEPLAADKP